MIHRLRPRTNPARTNPDEEGRILVWAAAGLAFFAVIALSLALLSRFHLARAQLAALCDIATVTAAAQVDDSAYFTSVGLGPDGQIPISPTHARALVDQSLAAQLASLSGGAAAFHNLQITDLQVSAGDTITVKIRADVELVGGGLGRIGQVELHAQASARVATAAVPPPPVPVPAPAGASGG